MNSDSYQRFQSPALLKGLFFSKLEFEANHIFLLSHDDFDDDNNSNNNN
jgi:hypothetical protein